MLLPTVLVQWAITVLIKTNKLNRHKLTMKSNKNLFLTLIAAIIFALSPLSMLAGDNIILKSPEDYQVMCISPNGKWACGVYNDYSYSSYAFRWNLESGAIELLSTGDESEAWCISDEGVVSGTFTDRTYNVNHAAIMMPGYYDTEWHMPELPPGSVSGGCAYSITPDGHHMAGTVYVGKNIYQTYIWADGKIERALHEGGIAQAYTISPDGQAAGGWIDTGNRQAAYWKPDGTTQFLSEYKSPWSCVRKFSPDGKKILFWGGWNTETESVARLRAIYDIESGEVTDVPVITPEAAFELYDISGNYTLAGEESGRGYINVNGQGMYIDAYLAQLGIDVSTLGIIKPEGYDYYVIQRVECLSADDSVMALLYYDEEGALRSMIIKLNVEAEGRAPAELKVSQLPGIPAAKLTWIPALGSAGITGYNVYRDGVKVNDAPVSGTEYYDSALEYGNTYSYAVTALYESGESPISNTAKLNLTARGIEAPQNLYSRQVGYNDAMIRWQHPESNLITKKYFDLANSNVRGFGVSVDDITFENAIRFGAAEVKAYAGCKVKSVQFYPMSNQTGWKVNLYTYNAEGALQQIYTQDITQSLEMGKLNTVELDTPQDLPDGELIVAIQVTVSTASQNVLGMDYGQATEEYSDLLRQIAEADFYSITESSSTSGYFYRTQWLISAIFSPAGAAEDVDVVDHYNVYLDDAAVASTPDLQIVKESVDNGSHTVGVEAVYADGRISDKVTTDLTVKADAKLLLPVDVVNTQITDETTLLASWDAPKCFDKGYISYSGVVPASKSVKGPESNNYGLMAGVVYPSEMLRGYDGYQIRSVRCYPGADAPLTSSIFKDNVQVGETYVEDCTLNEWNTVELDTPIEVAKNSEYFLVIDCYDVTPNSAALAVDTTMPYTFYSDLYSLDGQSWDSIASAAIYGNWMMGLNLESTEESKLPIIGYDVNIDGVTINDETLTATNTSFTFPSVDTEKHSISVDTNYPAGVVKRGAANYFYLSGSGVENVVSNITLLQGANMLTVTGGNVTRIRVFSVAGSIVRNAEGNTVAIDGLAQGVYVVKATVDGKRVIRKIRISK